MIRLTQEQIAHIRALENGAGQLTPAQLVADARAADSPLHGLFEWNQKRAAERYWLTRARRILGAVTVVVVHETTTIRAPVYVHLPDGNRQGYQRVSTLREQPTQAREALIAMLETAAGHLRRAVELAGPLGLQGEIDRLLEEIVGVERLIKQAA
jgi:hypothetical protein